MSKTINLGRVTAYADAVAAGYTGTREQFANDLANAANYAAEAGDAAETATEAATTASTAAETATTKAEEASADAEQAHADAQAILGAKETAVAAAATASSKAGEAANSAQQAAASETAAAGSATTASNAATSATASKNAAATSETNAANSANAAAQTLTNVNQAGATQVAAIQAKGTEVLNSIPADYTELSNDVDALKSDISDVINPSYTVVDDKAINGNTGTFPAISGYSYAETDVLPGCVVKGYTFAAPNEPTRGYAFYDINGNYITGGYNTNATNDWTYELTAPDNAYIFRISIRTSEKSNFTMMISNAGLASIKSVAGVISNVADGVMAKEEINVLIGNTELTQAENYEVGSLYVQGGAVYPVENTTRVRQKIDKAQYLHAGDTIGLSDYSHYRYIVFTSNDRTTWVQSVWKTADTVVQSNQYYLLLLEDTNSITQTSPDTLVSMVQFIDSTSYVAITDKRLNVLETSIRAPKAKFAHLSFDDVRYCMIDLTNNANTYTSIFDNPFFAMLKRLHDTYGTVVSLYLFLVNPSISTYTTAFANEFAENADWLKFGLHQGGTNYASTSAETALSDYNTFTSNIVNICGTLDVIDRCPRLGNFAGNLDSVLAMRDADAGIIGLLSAYDTRDSYYLDSATSIYLYNHGKYFDADNQLEFFRTIKTFEAYNPVTELATLNTLAGYNGSPYGIIMMHEYGVYTSSYELVSSMVERLDYACEWMNTNGYVWEYPMNRIIKGC